LPILTLQKLFSAVICGSWVSPVTVPPDACCDKNDLPVLGTAIAADAPVLVTGDKDLLTLHPFQNIAILSPRDFHTRFVAIGP